LQKAMNSEGEAKATADIPANPSSDFLTMTNLTTFGNIVWEQRWADTGSCSTYQVQTTWFSDINSALRSYTHARDYIGLVSLLNRKISIVMQTTGALRTNF